MVEFPYMDIEDLKRLIEESPLSDRRISLDCGERHNFVSDIKRGVKPAFDSVSRLLEVLGYEARIMPKDDKQAVPPQQAESEKTPPPFLTFKGAGEAAPVRDPKLAEVLTALAEHYEWQNEYGRQYFIEEIKMRWPGLFRVPRGRVILWLGWSPGGPGER